jgi:hypothetical protein
VGRARALRRKTKASAGFPTEAFDVFRVFAFSALARLSARARHSRCPTEFGELSGTHAKEIANLIRDFLATE